MSGIDLTEAVDAALTATIPPHKPAVTWRRDIADPAVRAALPHIERQVREQVEVRALTVLREHAIECTGLGEVTCRGCRDRGWMAWSTYREHVATLIARGDS